MNKLLKRNVSFIMVICMFVLVLTVFTTSINAAGLTTYVIENFNDMTNPVVDMKPLDISAFGIGNAALSIVSENAEEGKAMKVVLADNTQWVQYFQIDDATRVSIFQNATNEHYVRLYISNSSSLAYGVTIDIRGEGTRAFPDSTNAILTGTDGVVVATTTGNITEDAGAGSSVNIPANFKGWIAWPLSTLIPWGANAVLSDFNTVNYVGIDIRCSNPQNGDSYTLDNFCLTGDKDALTPAATEPPKTENPKTSDLTVVFFVFTIGLFATALIIRKSLLSQR